MPPYFSILKNFNKKKELRISMNEQHEQLNKTELNRTEQSRAEQVKQKNLKNET